MQVAPSPTTNWPITDFGDWNSLTKEDILTALGAQLSTTNHQQQQQDSNNNPIYFAAKREHQLISAARLHLRLHLASYFNSTNMGELDQSGTSTSTPMEIEQFVASGRNGRRNAMADLGMSLDIDPGAYKLAEQMSQLETSDGAGCSGSQSAQAGSSGSATATTSGS